MQIKGYATFDPLHTAIVGDVFAWQHWQHLRDDRILSPLRRVIEETKQDLDHLADVLTSLGVEVHRPDMSQVPNNLATYARKPPQQVRDDMAIVGRDCYVANALPEYHHILSSMHADHVHYPHTYLDYSDASYTYDLNLNTPDTPDQQRLLSTSFIHLMGKDLYWGTNTPGWRNSPLIHHHKRTWEQQGFRVHIQAQEEMGGHGDATWAILKPGVIMTLFDVQQYEHSFPGWDILYLEDKYWDQLSPFRIMRNKVGGRWWIRGEEHNDQLINYVESWLSEWVGYCEETVFEINLLNIDQHTVIVNNYNKKVFDFFKKHHIEPIICPQRHRWFWDGGVHCLTQDLYREGEMIDYFKD